VTVIETVEIVSLAYGGDGIGRIEGQVCFVPFALPGDTVRVRITRRTKNALWGEIVEVASASPERGPAACPAFGRCGGCTWGHFAYPAQAEWKQRLVREALQRMAKVEAAVEWAEEPALRLGYRTRAEFHGDGALLGFHAPGSHDIVDIEQCPLCHPRLNAALDTLRACRVKGSITVTVNPEGEETLVWSKFAQRRLRDRFPLANHLQDERPRAMFTFDGAPIVNGAFSQSSLLLNRLLVRTVHEMAGDAATVLDLYCGNGNLSLGLAARAKVTGIDHQREAVRAASGVSSAQYFAGGEDRMAEALREQPWDVVLLDPPRTGAKALAGALARSKARAIVYVSCDPVTLARDLKPMLEQGWRIVRAVALDLFPNTAHMETVCRLEKG
jgi:23S rRNA (uracil1939-C5)-methyltransferase